MNYLVSTARVSEHATGIFCPELMGLGTRNVLGHIIDRNPRPELPRLVAVSVQTGTRNYEGIFVLLVSPGRVVTIHGK